MHGGYRVDVGTNILLFDWSVARNFILSFADPYLCIAINGTAWFSIKARLNNYVYLAQQPFLKGFVHKMKAATKRNQSLCFQSNY
jgi:hypothetical protein